MQNSHKNLPAFYYRRMAKYNTNTALTVLLLVLLVVATIYFIDPTFFGLLGSRVVAHEGYADIETAPAGGSAASGAKGGPMDLPGAEQEKKVKENPHVAAAAAPHSGSEGFADVAGYDADGDFSAVAGGCMQRDQLTPSELLPKDQNSAWAQQNPMGPGSLKGKQFLSAGALIGVNTVGSSLRNSNLQLRSEPPNPQQAVSVWNQSTIEPDINRRALDIQ